MSILARLRETTAPAHEKLDAGVELERRLARHEDRIGLVQAFHAFHSASEALLRRWLPAGHDLDARSRIASLEADLRALGAEPVAPSATTPADTSRALGWLYVVEGSSLGGRVIRRDLESRGVDVVGLSFLDPYGAQVGARWRETVAFLEGQSARPDVDGQAVLAGALDAFAYALQSLSPHDRSPHD